MTELEVHFLRPGEQVVVKRRNGVCFLAHFEGLIDHDMSREFGRDVMGFNEIDAVRYAFDGPIVVVREQDNTRSMWSAPKITRPKIEFRFVCQHCGVTYEYYLTRKSDSRPSFDGLSDFDRRTIATKTCGRCARKFERSIK